MSDFDNEQKTSDSRGYADASGSGVLSSILFVIFAIVVMAIASHYLG
jgi:hypothetical protein